MVNYAIFRGGEFMERILIYCIAAAGILAGLLLYYRKPSPFGRGTYDKKK